MATLRNKRKISAVWRETPEKTRNNQSQNTLNPGMTREYITQVGKAIEGRVIWKTFPRLLPDGVTYLCALSKVDEFLPNSPIRTCSVAVTGTSRNNNSENQEPTPDRSLDDVFPEMVFSACHTSNLNDSGQKETRHIATRVQEEIAYCSPETSSGKQKKALCTSQPQGRCENTPSTIQSEQILLALQQLATNTNSAHFNININRISIFPSQQKCPPLTRNQKKTELFDDFFRTSLKIHNQINEEDKKTISTLSCVVMRYKQSITSPAPTKRIW